ncbi:hypothetical protein DRP05_02435 [Archaeoglobales archaeon]|nr:MAG: hypothetical protein DRP05_02435 [Archaeoglobales archaeon]
MPNSDGAFTGLEASIVLIAFVVVGAVFGYTILGSGFFTAQKSKSIVVNGVKQASASLVLDGQYIYLACDPTGSSGCVNTIYFYVTQSAGGASVDLEKASIAVITKDGYEQKPYTSGVTPIIAGNVTNNITLNTQGLYLIGSTAYPPSGCEPLVVYITAFLRNTKNTSLTGDIALYINSSKKTVSSIEGTSSNVTATIVDGKVRVAVEAEKDGWVTFSYILTVPGCYAVSAGNSTHRYIDDQVCVGNWWWYQPIIGDSDGIVEANEKYKIEINVQCWDVGTITPDEVLTIELRPAVGAPLVITKQLPPSFLKLTYV